MLYFSGNFLAYLETTRTVHIEGRVGSGKTALSVALAAHLVNQGHYDYVCANLIFTADAPSFFYNAFEYVNHVTPKLDEVKPFDFFGAFVERFGYSPELFIDCEVPPRYVVDTVAILDEGGFVGTHSRDKRFFNSVTMNQRKDNMNYLVPSVQPVHKEASPISVNRVFNFFPLGFPAWVYEWEYKGQRKPVGGRFLFFPKRVFDWYQTLSKTDELDAYMYYLVTGGLLRDGYTIRERGTATSTHLAR
jgi:hypothetical protein